PLYSKKNRNTDQSTTIHYDNYNEDAFRVGTKVEHNIFGSGKIIAREGKGAKTKVTVFFKERGRKTLMLRVAKLKPIG
ncbi:MAG TPA: hypothetical protein VK106_06945, partial [Balneolaceae bacterium]|nr:hypothetical protein [Balneolaceae bacterium]